MSTFLLWKKPLQILLLLLEVTNTSKQAGTLVDTVIDMTSTIAKGRHPDPAEALGCTAPNRIQRMIQCSVRNSIPGSFMNPI